MMVAARRKTSRGERNPWMRGENWLAEKKGDKTSGGDRIEGPVSLLTCLVICCDSCQAS